MRRTEAARYARWSAGVAMVLAAITLGVYVQRGWVARRERHDTIHTRNFLRQLLLLKELPAAHS
ncbi:MAG: hypothetical protein LAN84_05095 [Acidobacteriia bacterium]|nr:hypothetical protein [Terriglobia bacterium]